MPARPLLEDQSAAPAPAIAITIPVRLIGMIVLALVAVMMVALASWSVDDPSFSYATSKPVANWLGFPGAVIADFSFQVLGLGIIVLLIPPALWGWSFLRRRVPSRMGLRLIAWIGASGLATGVLTFLPAPASWPLPTGLGGLIGTGFSNLAALVTGAEPQPVTAWLFAIILMAPTLALFWLALGLGAIAMPKAQGKARGKDVPERNGILDVAIGALVHLGFSAQTAFRRAIAQARANAAAKREAEAAEWRDGAAEPSLAARAPTVSVLPDERREPSLGAGLTVERRIFAPVAEPAAEDDYAEDEDDDEELPPIAPARSPRVAPPARRPAPGARAGREAQGSLLDDPSGFELPALSLLAEPRQRGMSDEMRPERLEAMARRLEGVLEDFGVKGDIINVRPGPVVTLYELEPAPGIKSSRVISLADDIARSMSAISARVAVVPGRNAIGIELPNEHRETVYLREMLASSDFEKMKGKLPICLGKTIGGEPIIADLARMPHLLIAGTTGSGKSVGINTFILSLLYQMTPEKCRLIMIDPKMLELSIYDGIPHLLTPVVTDPAKAVTALKWAVREMEDRYRKMSKIGVRNIDGFNQRVTEAAQKGETITRTVQTGFDRDTGEAIYESEEFNLEPLPFIVIVIDEMADLMMVAGKDIEGAVQRLAQMARAAGIHVIMATQRPSVDVITGTIKANFPTRISFQVTSKIDSRTILGEQGAEQLLGNGDMLYMAGGGRIRRLHGPFVSDGEVESIVKHLKMQGTPDYLDSITADEDDEFDPASALGEDGGGSGDELYDKAVNIVLNDKKASTSYVQRRLAIGYNKAASLIERMEKEGVISPANHSGKREILVGNDAY
ncbi:MAG: cell division protein FtsK [Devosia sp. 67-54]|uniref:FtsK/SpoIIIE family DNA translocase n=1 Tax=unclassified Devosia TaxID=196773 RepID=UPI00096321F3|nr:MULTISPECIES: DNA translocase FtsK [unclassified Devosia]MBN9305184.1 DNA translocase FtsK [Devosia sp.]OJX14893.1 MAG: cell division protein FtsK [Devosia sp. 67-54]